MWLPVNRERSKELAAVANMLAIGFRKRPARCWQLKASASPYRLLHLRASQPDRGRPKGSALFIAARNLSIPCHLPAETLSAEADPGRLNDCNCQVLFVTLGGVAPSGKWLCSSFLIPAGVQALDASARKTQKIAYQNSPMLKSPKG
jgi:hypothetical protein